jgi:hypothetical protein
MTILGGALRPGYSHISDTISELFSPGSPNKLFLDSLHSIYALLLIIFGIGIARFVRESKRLTWLGETGGWLYAIMGLVSLTTATIFPQDAWGTPPTFPGEMHKFLSAVVGLLSIFAMLLLGIWFRRSGINPAFGYYSFATISAAVVSAGAFAASYGSPIMGLTERIAAFTGFQWTFTLAFWIYLWTGRDKQ